MKSSVPLACCVESPYVTTKKRHIQQIQSIRAGCYRFMSLAIYMKIERHVEQTLLLCIFSKLTLLDTC